MRYVIMFGLVLLFSLSIGFERAYYALFETVADLLMAFTR